LSLDALDPFLINPPRFNSMGIPTSLVICFIYTSIASWTTEWRSGRGRSRWNAWFL